MAFERLEDYKRIFQGFRVGLKLLNCWTSFILGYVALQNTNVHAAEIRNGILLLKVFYRFLLSV